MLNRDTRILSVGNFSTRIKCDASIESGTMSFEHHREIAIQDV